MENQFEIKGEWFLPNYVENKVNGTFFFNPQKGGVLEVYGSLENQNFFPELNDQEIILGNGMDGEPITLTDCVMTHSHGAKFEAGQEPGKPKTIYIVTFTFIGIQVGTKEELKFDTITSEIFNLEEWVGISGIKIERPKYKQKKVYQITVNYELPNPIQFKIDEETKGKLIFLPKLPSINRFQKKAEISQKVKFCIETSSYKTIPELLEYLYKFQNFLILALYKTTFFLSVTVMQHKLQKKNVEGEKQNKEVKLLFSTYYLQENENPKLDYQLLFDYSRIENEFESIIQKWFLKYKKLGPAIDLLIEQFNRRNQFNINTFLNLAQSAETFHARINNHTKMKVEEYNKMKDEILKNTPPEYKYFINDMFINGNNLTLHKRLEEITNKYSNKVLDEIIPDKDEFVKQIKYSRNYYTHYSKGLERKALKGAELFYLTEKLKIQIICSILMEVGFTKEKLTSLMENVKWGLFNHLIKE